MAEILPTELWWKILRMVPSSSLCQMALVSRYFRQLTQDPVLWSHVNIRKDMIEKEGLENLLDNPRLLRVRKIDLSYLDISQVRSHGITSRYFTSNNKYWISHYIGSE